jgi:hypothetical protein
MTRRTFPTLPVLLLITVIFGAGTACTAGKSTREKKPDGIVTIDFNEYRGSLQSLPEGLFVTGIDGEGIPVEGEFYPFTGVNSVERDDDFAGFGAFTSDEKNYSFGIRERGSSDLRDSRLFLEYENRTDKTIYGLRLRYEVETWYVGDRDNRIRLKYHTRTRGFGSIDDIVSTTNPRTIDLKDKHGGTLVDGSLQENRTTVEIAFHFSQLQGMAEEGLDRFAPLRPGEKGYLRWQYSNGNITEGSRRSALALNNIRIEPIYSPAPSPDSETGRPEAPIAFSRDAGFYSDPFALKLLSSLRNARIYYTLDGSIPDPEQIMTDREWQQLPRATRRRTFEYKEQISLQELARRENDISLIRTNNRKDNLGWKPPESPIPKAIIVRAVAESGKSRSAVRSASYFLPLSNGEQHQLPVWSIKTDRGNFFNPETGIYVPGTDLPRVNYFHRGVEWEPVAHTEFFEEDGRRVISQNLGVRIHGNYTRNFPQKSLKLYSRSDYGPGRMGYQFFDTKETGDYNRLLLRNGGNDWIGAMLTDPTLHSLVEHLPIDTQHYRPSVVYLNGEYWGIHNMRDRQDQHFLETHYDIPRDEVVIVEIEGIVNVGQETRAGELYQPYIDFRDRVSSGELADWDTINEEMALSEYIDYLFAEVYAGNYDWPWNNIRYWRYTGPEQTDNEGPRDGRWRWFLYDVDFSFGHQLSTTFDMVEWTFGYSEEHPFLQEGRRAAEQERYELNNRLIEIDEIRRELLQRFAVHLATTAREERAKELIDQHAERIASEMPRQIDRWNGIESMDKWREAVGSMHDFARRRPGIVRDHILAFFDDVNGLSRLTLEGIKEDSRLSLHTVEISQNSPGVHISDGRWSGLLFTGIPVVLESDSSNLNKASFGKNSTVEIISRSREKLSFYLNDATVLSLPPPQEE